MSKKLSAAASTSTTTSPRPGSGLLDLVEPQRLLRVTESLHLPGSHALSSPRPPYDGIRDYHSDKQSGMVSCRREPGWRGVTVEDRRDRMLQGKGLDDAGHRYARTRGERRRGVGSCARERNIRHVPVVAGRPSRRAGLRQGPSRRQGRQGRPRVGHAALGAPGRHDDQGYRHHTPARHHRARGARDLRPQDRVPARGGGRRTGRHHHLVGHDAYPHTARRGARQGNVGRGRGPQRARNAGRRHGRDPGPQSEHSVASSSVRPTARPTA